MLDEKNSAVSTKKIDERTAKKLNFWRQIRFGRKTGVVCLPSNPAQLGTK